VWPELPEHLQVVPHHCTIVGGVELVTIEKEVSLHTGKSDDV